MTGWTVHFTPEATDQLAEFADYITRQGDGEAAARYVEAIVGTCEGLARLPHVGQRRDDVRPGLRITHHRGRTVIAFVVDDESRSIAVLGVYYGGRDYAPLLADDAGRPEGDA